MYRLLLPLLLSLALFVGYQTVRSSPSLPPDDRPQPMTALTTGRVADLSPFVWWEAEAAIATNFPALPQNPFAPRTPQEAALLSGGQWIGVDGRRNQPLFLEYQVSVPTSGRYHFYVRKFWKHGPFRWQWDDGLKNQGILGRRPFLLDSVALRSQVGANWVSLGRISLSAGEHRLRVELTEPEGPAAFDCFVLTQKPFQPRGKLRPNERYRPNLPGWFVFDAEPDPFRASAIDLRSLNEAFAGAQGRIRVRGEAFVHESGGAEVRFWGVNLGEDVLAMDRDQMADLARFLAKRGVNLARFHGKLWDRDFRRLDPLKRDRLFALVAALKQEGIYTSLSIYFPLWLKLGADSGFAGYSGEHPFALLFFNRQFQEIYWNWWRSLLTPVNPATGKSLADDPAVAMAELVNEDSLLFWTFEPYKTIPAAQMGILEQQFGDWLISKYGTLPQAFDAWSPRNGRIRGDDPLQGRVGILSIPEILAQQDSRRAQDTATFLTEVQTRFFRAGIRMLREQLGYDGLIYGSNWKTADARLLDPLDKLSNAVGDFFDRHGYFGGPHRGDRATYTLSSGDRYHDRSALRFTSFRHGQPHDLQLPLMDIQYDGKPSTLSEVNWPQPNRFRAEFPVLAAAYGQLQGTDGIFFFATQTPGWEQSMDKFAIATPSILGQFPAAALIYRQGLVKPGETVVDVALDPQQLRSLQGAPLSAPQNFDALRSQEISPSNSLSGRDRVDSIDPLTFLVGKVKLRFQPHRALPLPPLNLAQLPQFLPPPSPPSSPVPPAIPAPSPSPSPQTIRSNTGELLWNYDIGFVTLNAPQAQGITGFLQRAGQIDLQDLQFTSDLSYGTLLLVSLDGQAIAQSRHLLLQVMSEEQNFGWQTNGFPERQIEHLGSPPIVVRNLAGEVTLKRRGGDRLTVTALDLNGYPTRTVARSNRFSLLPNTLYYEIRLQ